MAFQGREGIGSAQQYLMDMLETWLSCRPQHKAFFKNKKNLSIKLYSLLQAPATCHDSQTKQAIDT